ncbi:MAG: hypothetical protein ABIQ47_12975 [Tepidiformaceae bacterium]
MPRKDPGLGGVTMAFGAGVSGRAGVGGAAPSAEMRRDTASPGWAAPPTGASGNSESIEREASAAVGETGAAEPAGGAGMAPAAVDGAAAGACEIRETSTAAGTAGAAPLTGASVAFGARWTASAADASGEGAAAREAASGGSSPDRGGAVGGVAVAARGISGESARTGAIESAIARAISCDWGLWAANRVAG